MAMTGSGKLANLLGDSDFRRVWLIGIYSGISHWLKMLVVGVYAFRLVTLLVALRLLPLVLLGSVIGALADRASPRLLLVAGQGAATLVSATVCVLLVARRAEYWMIAAAAFASVGPSLLSRLKDWNSRN